MSFLFAYELFTLLKLNLTALLTTANQNVIFNFKKHKRKNHY